MGDRSAAFERAYGKFAGFVAAHDLIPPERRRVVVAYSGGKDASLLAELLREHRQRARPDLDLELVTAIFPRFLYAPDDPARRRAVDDAIGYWRDRGFEIATIDAGAEYPDSVLDGENPCQRCALEIKPTLLGRQLIQSRYRDAVFCVGLTLDDAIGWFVELQLATAGRDLPADLETQNPELFSLIMRLAVRVCCRLRLQANNLLYSRPLMGFCDEEIVGLVAERGLPLIPEDCARVLGREEIADSPRREIGVALRAMRRKYPADGPIGDGALLYDYESAARYFEESGLLPELEDRQHFLSRALESIEGQ